MSATYDLIGSVSVNANSVTISNIPQTYKDLIIVYKQQLAAGSEELRIRFNGNTSNNYMSGRIGSEWTPGNPGASNFFNLSLQSNSIISRRTTSTGNPISMVLHVYNYASTTRVKAYQAYCQGNIANNNTIGWMEHIVGAWNLTDAITSVTFFPNQTPNSNSIGSIYGIG